MKLVIVTRQSDGKKMYINPRNVCAVYPHYQNDCTVIQFPGAVNFLEVLESVETVAAMIEGSEE